MQYAEVPVSALILAIAAESSDQPEPLFKCTTQVTLTSLGATLSNLSEVDFTKILGRI